MADYYLISQLPSLDGLGENAPLPITEERFLELCERLLGKAAVAELRNLTLTPMIHMEKNQFALIEEWNRGERDLRLALGKARAEKMHKSFDMQGQVVSAELWKVASAAIEYASPLEAERFLLQHRLQFLETLRPMDGFSKEFLFYYGLKLKLILRMRQFDQKAGETAYRNIYNSIINGDRLEALS